MFSKKILSMMTGAALFGVAGSAMAIPLVPDGDLEGIFFRNSEVFIDNNQDGILNTGDQLWGVANLNEITNAGSDPTGQTGFQIWPLGGVADPAEVTAYFAIEVVATLEPGDGVSGATGNTLIFAPTIDPNGILVAGDVFNIYEDSNIDYNDATQGSALSTSTDGSLLGSFAMPNPANGAAGDSYWYALAPTTPFGDGSTGESFTGLLEGSDPFPFDFGAINDPSEDYSSGAGVAGGLTVDFFFNTELLILTAGFNSGFAIGDDQPMHIGSNDPGIFAPLRVPEPTTLALMGMGMLGIGLGRRRRKV